MIFDDELMAKVALVPLKLTAVPPAKLLPLIVTLVPTGPLLGDKLEIEGAAVKTPAPVAAPPEVVTLIVPVVTPDGTTAEICSAALSQL